jgi:putative membrane protein
MTVTRFVGLLFKGAAMGAANVIPGVSGGTIALITGIYADLIDTLKSFNWKAVKLFTEGDFRKWFDHLNGPFACAVGLGVAASILTVAGILDYSFRNHLTLTFAFFFGLILASIFLVGRQVPKWNPLTGFSLLAGIAAAAAVVLIKPLAENDAPLYIFLCGVVAMCSMILPGISGSFILILMGNFFLLVKHTDNIAQWPLTANIFQESLPILLPFAAGCAVGLLGFSRVLSVILEKFKATVLAVLTGFVAGSLAVIWPWKDISIQTETGQQIFQPGEMLPEGYRILAFQNWHLPPIGESLMLAVLLMLAGAGLVLLLDKVAGTKKPKKDTKK